MLSGGLRTKNITKRPLPEQPLITVITVVRNGEKTLEETILSVINQTYQNVEYIVVDGASTDGTLDIIRKYEEWIDYWISEPDKGIYDAMNKGIELGNGEWVLLVNSDDKLIDNLILYTISKILNTTKADIVHGNMIAVYPNGRERQAVPAGEKELLKSMCLNHGTCFVRNSLYKVRKYNCQYKTVADYDFLLWGYINKYKFEYINNNMIYFSATGITGKPSLGNREAFKIWQGYYGNITALLYFLRDFLPKLIKVPIKRALIKMGLY
jgi:glycosyltransferase involved in cell wall biosynthesis